MPTYDPAPLPENYAQPYPSAQAGTQPDVTTLVRFLLESGMPGAAGLMPSLSGPQAALGANFAPLAEDLGTTAATNAYQDNLTIMMDNASAMLAGPGAYSPEAFNPIMSYETIPTPGISALERYAANPDSIEGLIADHILAGGTATSARRMIMAKAQRAQEAIANEEEPDPGDARVLELIPVAPLQRDQYGMPLPGVSDNEPDYDWVLEKAEEMDAAFSEDMALAGMSGALFDDEGNMISAGGERTWVEDENGNRSLVEVTSKPSEAAEEYISRGLSLPTEEWSAATLLGSDWLQGAQSVNELIAAQEARTAEVARMVQDAPTAARRSEIDEMPYMGPDITGIDSGGNMPTGNVDVNPDDPVGELGSSWWQWAQDQWNSGNGGSGNNGGFTPITSGNTPVVPWPGGAGNGNGAGGFVPINPTSTTTTVPGNIGGGFVPITPGTTPTVTGNGGGHGGFVPITSKRSARSSTAPPDATPPDVPTQVTGPPMGPPSNPASVPQQVTGPSPGNIGDLSTMLMYLLNGQGGDWLNAQQMQMVGDRGTPTTAPTQPTPNVSGGANYPAFDQDMLAALVGDIGPGGTPPTYSVQPGNPNAVPTTPTPVQPAVQPAVPQAVPPQAPGQSTASSQPGYVQVPQAPSTEPFLAADATKRAMTAQMLQDAMTVGTSPGSVNPATQGWPTTPQGATYTPPPADAPSTAQVGDIKMFHYMPYVYNGDAWVPQWEYEATEFAAGHQIPATPQGATHGRAPTTGPLSGMINRAYEARDNAMEQHERLTNASLSEYNAEVGNRARTNRNTVSREASEAFRGDLRSRAVTERARQATYNRDYGRSLAISYLLNSQGLTPTVLQLAQRNLPAAAAGVTRA